jgi:cytochrome c oxidase assembly protein subunit 15
MFRMFAYLATAAVYFLIFLGGLVRVSGAGLGCPDWPRCFGRWIPPLDTSQLPPDIDSSLFNFTLAWIEYINRLVGVAVGLLIAVVAVLALVKYRSHLRIVLPAVAAALLTAFQGWQGSRVVASGLEPLLVSSHLVIAFMIAGLMVWVSVQAYHLGRRREPGSPLHPGRLRLWLGILWLLTLGQVVLGTRVREALEAAAESFPLLADSALTGQIGAVKYVHPALAVVVAAVTILLVYRLMTGSGPLSPLLWQAGWSMAGLVLLQLVFGIILIWLGLPAVTRLLHLWVAGLLMGVVLLSYAEVAAERTA